MSEIRNDIPPPSPKRRLDGGVKGLLEELKNYPLDSYRDINGRENTVRVTASRVLGSGCYAMRSTATPGVWRVWRVK